MIRAVVFDLWNTLVHSRDADPYRHLRKLLRPAQLPSFTRLKREAMLRPYPDARTFLEGQREAIDLDEEQVEAMTDLFRDASLNTQPYPETLRALEETRALARLGLLSNTQSFDMDFMERLGLNALIPVRHPSCDTGLLKPDPQAFEAIRKHMSLFPGEMAMVGDSWTDDMEGALAAGWTAIWVNRGNLPRPDLDPEAELVVVPDLSPVPDVIGRLQAGARCSTCLG